VCLERPQQRHEWHKHSAYEDMPVWRVLRISILMSIDAGTKDVLQLRIPTSLQRTRRPHGETGLLNVEIVGIEVDRRPLVQLLVLGIAGVNFQPVPEGQFSGGVDTAPERSDLILQLCYPVRLF
jgi:hypothetical protein